MASNLSVKRIIDLLAELQEQHESELNFLRAQAGLPTRSASGELEQGIPGERCPLAGEEQNGEDQDKELDFLIAQAVATRRSHTFGPEHSISGNGVFERGSTPPFCDDEDHCGPAKSELFVQPRPEEDFELRGEWLKFPVASHGFNESVNSRLVDIYARDMWGSVQHESMEIFGLSPGRMRSAALRMAQQVQPRFLLKPTDQRRVTWDIAGIFLITYDMITIPVLLCFHAETSTFTEVMGWVALLFWTIDMLWSVVTGYYQEGQLIMDQKRILLNYLKGWFWIDCLVVIPDWVMKSLGSVTNAAGLTRILRIARIMRVLRLLRLLKLKKLFNIVYDFLDSEAMFIAFNLIKMLLVIVFMNHLVACAWYLVGYMTRNADAHSNWLENAGHTPVWGQDLAWKYLTALHWSITQFTPASMDVSATNHGERLFSIIILFWALVALSSIIGSVSASMTALRNLSADENKQFWILRRYLKQKHIQSDLTQRIIKHVEHQQMQKDRVVTPGSVKLLSQLSVHLAAELQYELNMPILREHPIFSHMEDEGNQDMTTTLHRICNSCLSLAVSAAQENLFCPGDEGRFMYFVKLGSYEYQTLDGTKIEVPLKQKLWTAEAVLWTLWRHRGWMKATEPSECLAISPVLFSEVFKLHPKPWYFAHNYGTAFVKYLNQAGLDAMTDVVFDHDVWHAIVMKSDSYVLHEPKPLLHKPTIRSTESATPSMLRPSEPGIVRIDAMEVSIEDNNMEVI